MIKEDVSVLADFLVKNLTENNLQKNEIKNKLSRSFLNILEYVREKGTTNYNNVVKINPKIKNGVIQKYLDLLNLCNELNNKEQLAKKLAFYQLIHNVRYMTIHNAIIDCIEQKKNKEELLQEIDSVLKDNGYF